MRLLLIRHGQTPSNVSRVLDTEEPGASLTELGTQQAAALTTTLVAHDIAVLYASTLVRTQQTAAPLAAERGLEIRVRAGLRELVAGELEMRGDHESIGTYLRTAFAWSAGETQVRIPGGENGVEALGRFDAVVAEAAATGAATAALVSHGAVIRMWVAARAGNVDPGFASDHNLENSGVVELEGSPELGWTVLSWTGAVVDRAASDGAVGAPVTEH
ncbi:histidine phosphatase family protein [Nocardiopsis ansamitocini]|uniref:Isomerase n=1 Tax=Nocardiopsis ansamitocini TaxID=1670832 RepID=A0A9W6PB42_9ACTN|nr:histidine phosphatase family protein [Nocardiopsis ansamitocini]GLU50272.1 isomerase [Nocardiopsis ansamitocini]